MRSATGGTTEPVGRTTAGGLPTPARRAARRAGLIDTERALLLGFGPGGDVSAEAPEAGNRDAPVAAAWREHRHLIVRCGDRLRLEDAVVRLASAGVSADTPALLATGLGTAHEKLLYGSLSDAGHPGFEGDSVLVVPHPAALPMDFAWPPTAAP